MLYCRRTAFYPRGARPARRRGAAPARRPAVRGPALRGAPGRPTAGTAGSAIGAIQITDGFSLVDVTGEVVDQVVRALRAATIRGRTLPVRLDRDVRQP